ncbi:MAG: SDR family NAD(P)-dependent oxidoreductase [Solirubrobacteraceae bacterium]
MASRAVLITGCSSGIGHATAQRLLTDGWTVYASARRPEAIADLAERGAHTLALDVTDERSMSDAVARVTEAEGAVGVLINNAGYSQSGAVETVGLGEVRREFETNVFGLIRCCQLVLPGMREQGWGKIVNIGSMGGRVTFPGGGIYHATKYALEAVSDAMRFELRGFGVDVILIELGLIVTRFGDVAAGSVTDTSDAAGVYAAFNRHVAKLTAGAYRGPIAKLGGGPEVVADVIAAALAAKRPKARYAVTPSAHLMIGLRRITPDRVWDLVMRAQFPTPRR